MEKHKLILISLVAGITEAILLFAFFSFGAVIGSHLRFYGYRRVQVTNPSRNIIRDNSLFMSQYKSTLVYLAQIQSVKNGKLTVLNINKKHYTFNLSSAKVYSFTGKKEGQNVLSANDYILIRKIGKNLVIRLL